MDVPSDIDVVTTENPLSLFLLPTTGNLLTAVDVATTGNLLTAAEALKLIEQKREQNYKSNQFSEAEFQSMKMEIPQRIRREISYLNKFASIYLPYGRKLTDEQLMRIKNEFEPLGYIVSMYQDYTSLFVLRIQWGSESYCSIL